MKKIIFAVITLLAFNSAVNAQNSVSLPNTTEEAFEVLNLNENYGVLKNDIITMTPDWRVNATVHENATGIELNIFGHGRTFIDITPSMLGVGQISNPDVALTKTATDFTAIIVCQTDQGVWRVDYTVPLYFNTIAPLQIFSGPVGSPTSFNGRIDADHRTNSDIAISYCENNQVVVDALEDPFATSTFTQIAGFPVIAFNTSSPMEEVLKSDVAFGSDNLGNRNMVISFVNQIPWGTSAQQNVVYIENSTIVSTMSFPYYQNGIMNPLHSDDTYVNYANICSEDLVQSTGQMRWTLVRSEMDGITTGPYSHISVVHSANGVINTLFNYVDDNPTGPYGPSYHFAPICADMGLNGDVDIVFRSDFSYITGPGVTSVMNPYQGAYQDWYKVNLLNSTPSKGSISVASDGQNYTICWIADNKLFYKTLITGSAAYRLENTTSASVENAIVSNTRIIDISGKCVYSGTSPNVNTLIDGIYIINNGKSTKKISILNGHISSN